MTVLEGQRDLTQLRASGLRRLPALRPFSPLVIEFLADLSRSLLMNPAARQYPDVVTFAFWCRRAALEREATRYAASDRLGRGTVFHIAPGNVPVNFAYSLAAGLLAGNANVVRLPSQQFVQVDLIADEIDRLRTRHPEAADYAILVRYDRTDRAVTDSLSRQCDVRVIWGGDRTIADIRRSVLSARAYDVTFSDRYSLCVIDAQSYLALGDDQRRVAAKGFYNDTYLFDQNACTAPHLVIWFGQSDEVDSARESFWSLVHDLVESQYHLESVAAVDKLTAVYRYAATHDGCRLEPRTDNLLLRAELAGLPKDLEDFRATCGLFYERHCNSLDELADLVTTRYQTLSYLGLDRQVLLDFVLDRGLPGIDRIVPVGQTLDFDLRWDGYDLVESLSRVVGSR